MIYRHRMVEVDALPLQRADGATVWVYREHGSDGPAQEMSDEEFQAAFEPGQAVRFTEEHLQNLARETVKLMSGVKRLEVPQQHRNRASYREGFSDAVQMVLLLMKPGQEILDRLKEEYPEWDQRTFGR